MITPLYAIPLAILFLILTARVITYRRENQIGLGDQGDKSLAKRMRAQANFTETTPFALVLMWMVEAQGTSIWVVNLIGVLLLAGRVAHAYGFSASPPRMKLRVNGMLMTLSAFLVAIIALTWNVLSGLIFAAL